ncbi:serine hydrolase [Parapedobacter tibetensis]|uniref:serine hydrolase n=1 Tax=Parapedobacter tibetensis TaxID=2972951 RepID=UPI00214DBCF8|nr:serine hydrolase [Parapedobacter tibetensis]
MKKSLFNLLIFCSITVKAQIGPIPEIEKSLTNYCQNDNYSGVVLISKDKKILLEKAFGYAHLGFKVPNNLETKFNTASMGKMYTAIAIMQLREKAKLRLADKVGEILPDYPNESVRDSITIEQLLTHTSGLKDFFNEKFEFKAKHTVRSLQDYFDFFKDEPLKFTPGSKFSYSNAGYIILGMIIEKLSGQNYYDYVKEHIYLPAGMENTDCYENDAAIENLAEGYRYLDGDNVWKTSNYSKGAKGSSAGGCYTTAHDLLKFVTALQNNTLISANSLALMISDERKNGYVEGFEHGYGYGFSLNKFNKEDVYGHNGGAPGVSAELDIYKNSDYVVITLSNRGSLDGWVQVRSIIREAIAGPTKETDKYLGTMNLIEIYKDKGYKSALKFMKSMDGNVEGRLLNSLANKYRTAKEYDHSIDVLKLIMVNNPESWHTLGTLADVYLSVGLKSEAIKKLNEILELNPENDWAKERLAEIIEN